MLAHCASAGVGQQVDKDIPGEQGKDVVSRFPKGLNALGALNQSDWFNRFDAERFWGMKSHKSVSCLGLGVDWLLWRHGRTNQFSMYIKETPGGQGLTYDYNESLRLCVLIMAIGMWIGDK